MEVIDTIQKLDTQLFLFFNSIVSCILLNYFFIAITDARFWIVPAIIAAALFIKQGHNKALTVLLLALLTIAITDPVSSQIFKPLLHRHRPCHPDFFVNSAHMLFGFKSSFSFPSSHSTNMFALAYIFTKFYPSRWLLFFSFAALIGFSRIYVGVHYPGDVLGGAFLGIIIAWIVYESYHMSRTWRESIIQRRASRKIT